MGNSKKRTDTIQHHGALRLLPGAVDWEHDKGKDSKPAKKRCLFCYERAIGSKATQAPLPDVLVYDFIERATYWRHEGCPLKPPWATERTHDSRSRQALIEANEQLF